MMKAAKHPFIFWNSLKGKMSAPVPKRIARPLCWSPAPHGLHFSLPDSWGVQPLSCFTLWFSPASSLAPRPILSFSLASRFTPKNSFKLKHGILNLFYSRKSCNRLVLNLMCLSVILNFIHQRAQLSLDAEGGWASGEDSEGLLIHDDPKPLPTSLNQWL